MLEMNCDTVFVSTAELLHLELSRTCDTTQQKWGCWHFYHQSHYNHKLHTTNVELSQHVQETVLVSVMY